MTRNEFLENVTWWTELLDFCSDEGCDYCDNIYDEYGKDEYFNDQLLEMARNADDWQDLYSRLEDIPCGYDRYLYSDYGEWESLDDDDFERYKEDVLDWGDTHGIWDDEEEVEEEEGYAEDDAEEDDDAEELEPDESMSLGDLLVSCVSTVQVIACEQEKRREQEDQAFQKLFHV